MDEVFKVPGVPLERLTLYVRRRCRNPSDVEDVVQETIVRTLEQGGKQSLNNPVAYAFRVADSLIYRSARKAAQLQPMPDYELACSLPGVEETLDYQQRFVQFYRALDAMPSLRREVFILRQVRGQSREEIASALGLTIEAVKKHLVRARIDLAELRTDLMEISSPTGTAEEASQ